VPASTPESVQIALPSSPGRIRLSQTFKVSENLEGLPGTVRRVLSLTLAVRRVILKRSKV